MFGCRECPARFAEPALFVEDHGLEGPPYEYYRGCPVCGGTYEPLLPCPGCGAWYGCGESVCPACLDAAIRGMEAWIRANLSPAEAQALAAWVEREGLPC